jgi:hypothetical protein
VTGSMGFWKNLPVKFLRESSEAEMVATFLIAEIDSHQRYDGPIQKWLAENDYSQTLIRNVDLDNEEENRARSRCLGECRGWEDRTLIFTRFPQSLSWSLRCIEESDLPKIQMVNYVEWIDYAGGTRNFADYAQRIIANDPEISDTPTTRTICAIRDRLESGAFVPPMIAVTPEDESVFVMLEGHARTTARFAANQIVGAEIMIGSAAVADLQHWCVY